MAIGFLTPPSASYAVELLLGAEESPGTNQEHREQAEERRDVGEQRVTVTNGDDLDAGHEERGGNDAGQTVEAAHQGDRESLQAEDVKRGLEADVARVQHSGQPAAERRQCPGEGEDELEVDA